MKDVKQIADYIVYCISKRVPFAEIIYSSLEVSDEMPDILEDDIYFATDGITLYVNQNIWEKYLEDKKRAEMSLLHELLHVYYGHPIFADGKRDNSYEYEEKCDDEVNEWVKKVYDNSEEKRCRVFDEWDFLEDQRNHILWYHEKGETSMESGSSEKEAESNSEQSRLFMQQGQEIWEEIQKRVSILSENEMDSMKQSFGYGMYPGSSSHEASILEVTEDVHYTDVLKRYVKTQEQEYLLDEEMDVMLYTYGFDLYEDVTFIEPPEIVECPMVHVYMAVDISGSCDTDMVAKFLGQTKKVLGEIAGKGKRRMDIYLFLCDTEIQQEFHITSIEEFPKENEFKITWGGTSFIPVFERTEELIRENGDDDTALFYYTDGMGSFPEKKPRFDTFFLMEKEDMDWFYGPKWIRLITI